MWLSKVYGEIPDERKEKLGGFLGKGGDENLVFRIFENEIQIFQLKKRIQSLEQQCRDFLRYLSRIGSNIFPTYFGNLNRSRRQNNLSSFNRNRANTIALHQRQKGWKNHFTNQHNYNERMWNRRMKRNELTWLQLLSQWRYYQLQIFSWKPLKKMVWITTKTLKTINWVTSTRKFSEFTKEQFRDIEWHPKRWLISWQMKRTKRQPCQKYCQKFSVAQKIQSYLVLASFPIKMSLQNDPRHLISVQKTCMIRTQ